MKELKHSNLNLVTLAAVLSFASQAPAQLRQQAVLPGVPFPNHQFLNSFAASADFAALFAARAAVWPDIGFAGRLFLATI